MIKTLIFVSSAWLCALIGMELYFSTFMNMEVFRDKKRQLIHATVTICVVMIICGYILWQYSGFIESMTRGIQGLGLFVGILVGFIWNMLFNPIYETWIDYQNGDFD